MRTTREAKRKKKNVLMAAEQLQNKSLLLLQYCVMQLLNSCSMDKH